MTVKLAKLFGRHRSNTEAHEDLQQQQQQQHHQQLHHQQLQQLQQNQQHLPPPLPPLNANMKSLKYLEHLRSSYGCQPASPEEDDEDNVSLSSACMQRNHPYNNSQRPLLGDRRPQLTVVGAGGKKGKAGAGLAPSAIAALPPMSPPPPQRNYISPYVQQQKRDSARGLHGFNDFDALSQHHLQSPPLQSGYPYGSPPSPTAKSSDFCFDRPAEGLPPAALRRSIVDVSLSSECSTAASSPSRYFHQEAPKPTPVPPPVAVHQPAPAHPIVSSGSSSGTASPPRYYPKEAPQTPLSSLAAPLVGPPVAPRVPPKVPSPVYASRFEDDFCMRRPVLNTFHQAPPPPAVPAAGHKGKDGPFIFGIDPEDQATDYGLLSASPSPQISKSPLQQSLSDTSAASSGRGSRFLLRKRKSKKAPAADEDPKSEKNTKKAEKRKEPSVKCVVVGDAAVGKTSLIQSYLENRFNHEHVPTASDIYNADVNVNESPVHVTLCDTSGQDTLDPLRELCYPDSDVFLLCFSVVRPESFQAIKDKWAPKFAKSKASLILVGTQADLRTNRNVVNKLKTNGEKAISYVDAWDLATSIGAKYIETSSATQQDKVKDLFDTAIWEGLAPTTLPPTPSFWRKLFCLA
ncbi:uncharacterized protein RhoU isoform X1 [Drosophila bipectinata]|uniref:uncharacterized protein RhoU isoform X1 n=1 Tax=Drosophila bipectinata TaxID=42026 RepID=UPI0038B23D02